MKHDFTQLQLTRLVYGETTQAESDLLRELAMSVPRLGASLADMIAAKEALDRDSFLPPDRTLDRILVYSAASAPVSAS